MLVKAEEGTYIINCDSSLSKTRLFANIEDNTSLNRELTYTSNEGNAYKRSLLDSIDLSIQCCEELANLMHTQCLAFEIDNEKISSYTTCGRLENLNCYILKTSDGIKFVYHHRSQKKIFYFHTYSDLFADLDCLWLIDILVKD